MKVVNFALLEGKNMMGVHWPVITNGGRWKWDRLTPLTENKDRPGTPHPLHLCPQATGGQFWLLHKKGLGDPGIDIRSTIRPGKGDGGAEGVGQQEGGGVRLFFPSSNHLLCGVEEKRGAVKLERVPDIWSLVIAPRDAWEKINSDAQIRPQELNYIKEKGILVRFNPNKKMKEKNQ